MTLNKKELTEALRYVAKLAKETKKYDILNHVKVVITDNLLMMTATDLTFWIEAIVEDINMVTLINESSHMDPTLFKVKDLQDAVKKKKGLCIDVDFVDGKLCIDGTAIPASKRSVSDYPDNPWHEEWKNRQEGTLCNFSRLKRFGRFVSVDETRMPMNGIHFDFAGGGLKVQATDGRRAIRTYRDVGTSDAYRPPFDIILKDFSEFCDISFEKYDARSEGMKFYNDNFKLYVRSVSGTFPNVHRPYPANVNELVPWQIGAGDFQSLVDRVNEDLKEQGITRRHHVEYLFCGDHLIVIFPQGKFTYRDGYPKLPVDTQFKLAREMVEIMTPKNGYEEIYINPESTAYRPVYVIDRENETDALYMPLQLG